MTPQTWSVVSQALYPNGDGTWTAETTYADGVEATAIYLERDGELVLLVAEEP